MTELIDLRSKVTKRTHTHLTAISLATGTDISELVRRVLDSWTDQRVHEASIVLRLVQSEGNRRAGDVH